MRDQPPLPEDDAEQQDPPTGRLQPTSPAALTVCAVVGLVGGWLFHPLAEEVAGTAPVVTWTQPVALALVAMIIGSAAWATWRSVHVRLERLEPRRALNRLALARATAYVGALVAGAHGGYAVSWLGLGTDLAEARAWRSGLAALAAVGIVVSALLLERACRVRSDDEAP